MTNNLHALRRCAGGIASAWFGFTLTILLAGCGGGGGQTGSPGPQGVVPMPPTSTAAPVLTPQIVFTSDSSVVLPRAGSSYQFVASIQNGSGALTWSSSNPGAVAVDSSGRVTAVASLGSAVITVAAPGVDPVSASVAIAQPTSGTILVPSSDVVSQTPSQVVLKADSVTSSITPNALIVSGEKGGLLARVVSVHTSGNQVVADVAAASLPEAFQQISIDDTGPAQAVSVQFSGRQVLMRDRWGRTMRVASSKGFECTGNGTALDMSASLNSAVVNANLQTRRTFITNGLSIQEFEIATTLTIGIDLTPGSLDVRGQIHGQFECAAVIQSIPVAGVAFGPVVITPNIDIRAGFQGNLSVGGAVSLSAPTISRTQSVTVGLHYVNGHFVQVADGKPSGTVTLQPWTGTLGASIQGDFGPFVGVGIGITGYLGPFQLLKSSFAYANAYGKLTLDVPLVPAPDSPDYVGPTWKAAIGLGVGLEADISAGKLQPLLDKLHMNAVSASLVGVTLESTLLQNPTPTIDASPSVVTAGSAGFSTSVPCATLICLNYSEKTVRFIAFKDGSSAGQRLAEATLTSSGSANAVWTPAVSDNGSYDVAAYLYDGIFGPVGRPYSSDPHGKARFRVSLAGTPTSPPTTSPTVPPTTPPTAPPTTPPTAPPTTSPTAPPTTPPTAAPTTAPTRSPTTPPTTPPTTSPTTAPTSAPTVAPKSVTVSNTGGTGLNLRSAPNVSASVVKALVDGTKMSVIGGPVIANGYTWWNIQGSIGGTQYSGWSAIGEWLAPPPSIGATVTVSYSNGIGLHLHTSPSTSATVITSLPEGTQMSVIGGPVAANGYTWWNIKGVVGGNQYTGWSPIGDWLTPNPRY